MGLIFFIYIIHKLISQDFGVECDLDIFFMTFTTLIIKVQNSLSKIMRLNIGPIHLSQKFLLESDMLICVMSIKFLHRTVLPNFPAFL